MQSRGVTYDNLTASRYARSIMKNVRTHEPAKLSDTLIWGVYIDARSCERFSKLAPHVDDELKKFYTSLLRSEVLHFQDYLSLAEKASQQRITDTEIWLAEKEAELVLSEDTEFRLHCGVP